MPPALLDPYRDWLGLSGPPRHLYALLGLPFGESDMAKVKAAVERLVAALPEPANAEMDEQRTRLIHELEHAREVLTDATRRVAYDAEYRQATAARPSHVPSPTKSSREKDGRVPDSRAKEKGKGKPNEIHRDSGSERAHEKHRDRNDFKEGKGKRLVDQEPPRDPLKPNERKVSSDMATRSAEAANPAVAPAVTNAVASSARAEDRAARIAQRRSRDRSVDPMAPVDVAALDPTSEFGSDDVRRESANHAASPVQVRPTSRRAAQHKMRVPSTAARTAWPWVASIAAVGFVIVLVAVGLFLQGGRLTALLSQSQKPVESAAQNETTAAVLPVPAPNDDTTHPNPAATGDAESEPNDTESSAAAVVDTRSDRGTEAADEADATPTRPRESASNTEPAMTSGRDRDQVAAPEPRNAPRDSTRRASNRRMARPIELSEEQRAEIYALLRAARQDGQQRNFAAAKRKLTDAARLSEASDLAPPTARLQLLLDYVEQFWLTVDESLAGLAEQELVVGTERIMIVEVGSDQVVVRYRGKNERFPRRRIPYKLALAIADRWFEEKSAANQVIRGAYMAMNPAFSKSDVRQVWQQAEAEGADISDLMLALDDRYEDVR